MDSVIHPPHSFLQCARCCNWRGFNPESYVVNRKPYNFRPQSKSTPGSRGSIVSLILPSEKLTWRYRCGFTQWWQNKSFPDCSHIRPGYPPSPFSATKLCFCSSTSVFCSSTTTLYLYSSISICWRISYLHTHECRHSTGRTKGSSGEVVSHHIP